MRIKLGEKHWLNSDAFCYWITCEYTINEGKNAGSTAERRVSGYVPTFEQAVDTFIERQIRGAEIENYAELVEVINNLKAEVRTWRRGFGEYIEQQIRHEAYEECGSCPQARKCHEDCSEDECEKFTGAMLELCLEKLKGGTA